MKALALVVSCLAGASFVVVCAEEAIMEQDVSVSGNSDVIRDSGEGQKEPLEVVDEGESVIMRKQMNG